MLDGASRLDELVAAAVADGQPALGITDHGNMYGVLDFYRECKSQGIKPIIGTEAYMAHESRHERPARRGRIDDTGGDTESGSKLYYHLTLLAENTTGYRNLIQLSSLAFLEGYYYKPRLDWELLDKYSEGLIASTGCLGGHVLQSLLRGDDKGALEKASRLQDIFGRDNLFVELQDHGIPAQLETNPKLIEIAKKINAPLIATNDSHYTQRHDHTAHDALLCVQTGALLSDPNRFKFEGEEHYLKSAAEMRWLFRDFPEACNSTLWIAERANVHIDFEQVHLPDFPVPEGFANDEEYLQHLTTEGAKFRWGEKMPKEVVERLAFEIKVIIDMGFASYFLIVWDLIKHARDNNIRVGPGRGSAAGCAVAYALRITDLDPIKYDLLFERFLNPSRVSMPDIDMDFDSRYREEMIRYATEKYGRDHVAQIITFGTIKARNAVRDAARVLGYPYGLGDKIAKSLPPLVMGRDTPLKYCFEYAAKHHDGFRASSELRELVNSDPDVKRVVEVAMGLEGLKRSDGIHAAAVVITREALTEYLPIQRKPDPGQNAELSPVVTQYEMHGVEALGLLKMDFLGLRNLDVITDTMAMVRASYDPNFDIDTVSLTDPQTFDLLARGDTIGVFQLESPPMRALLKSLAPNALEDVAAVVALYRPGPMSVNMHYDYADYKNDRKEPVYFHPDAQELLSDTYGLMVYQESMMRVAQKFAGYSLAEADNLRKACGKKLPELMAKERDGFELGCENSGYGKVLGKQLFDVIEKFADYAFNKSHAYGYALVAYQTAYLKAHYPVEYAACLLSSVKGNFDKGAIYLSDARASGIAVRTPDINLSRSDFISLMPQGEKAVSFGLSAIRNVGEGLVEKMLQERDANGPFATFHEFAERAPEAVLNKRTVESLIKAGAFDTLGHPRRGLLMSFERILDSSVTRRRERDRGIMSLFGDEMASDNGFTDRVEIPALEFDKTDQLRNEKDMLGLYVSDHPLMGIEHLLRSRIDCGIGEAREREDGSFVMTGGVITGLAKKYTKKGDQMAVFILEDLDSSIEATVFPKTLIDFAHLLTDDAIVAIRGRIDRRDDARVGIMVTKVEVLEHLGQGARVVTLKLSAAAINESAIARLKDILVEFPGEVPVFVDMGGDVTVQLGAGFNVNIDKAMGDLVVAFGDGVVVV